MIEQEFRTALLAQPAVSALTSGMYPGGLPQGVSKPCITYQFHDGFDRVLSAGTDGINRYNVTLRVFAENYGTCRELTKAVLTYIHGLTTGLTTDVIVGAYVQNVFGDYEETLELYTSVIDFNMYVQET